VDVRRGRGLCSKGRCREEAGAPCESPERGFFLLPLLLPFIQVVVGMARLRVCTKDRSAAKWPQKATQV
jgi:hypothetical protein